jgi:hypothetical protein
MHSYVNNFRIIRTWRYLDTSSNGTQLNKLNLMSASGNRLNKPTIDVTLKLVAVFGILRNVRNNFWRRRILTFFFRMLLKKYVN